MIKMLEFWYKRSPWSYNMVFFPIVAFLVLGIGVCDWITRILEESYGKEDLE